MLGISSKTVLYEARFALPGALANLPSAGVSSSEGKVLRPDSTPLGLIMKPIQTLLSRATIPLLSAVAIVALGAGAFLRSAHADPSAITFLFQKQKDPAAIQEQARKVGDTLTNYLGTKVVTRVPGDYAATVQALVSKTADVAYLDSMGFLLARRDGGARILLAEQRMDAGGALRTDYDSVFVTTRGSSLDSLHDIISNASSIRMVFTSPTSTSGYVMAVHRLVQEGALAAGENPASIFKSVAYGGGYTQALEEVVAGRADVAAVSFYAVEGPSSEKYLSREKLDKLKVIARSPGVPTHVIALRAGLSDEQARKFKAAILRLTREAPELLSDVYGASRFVEVDEDLHVAKSAQALASIGRPVDSLLASGSSTDRKGKS